jgi:hypothetical protein
MNWSIERSTTCAVWLMLLFLFFFFFYSFSSGQSMHYRQYPQHYWRLNNNVMLESIYIRKRKWIEVCERITARSSSPLLWWEKKEREDENERSLLVGMWCSTYNYVPMYWIFTKKQVILNWKDHRMNECWPSSSFILMIESQYSIFYKW